MKTVFAKPGSVRGDWFIVDASDKTLGRLASQIAHRLKGKHKADYSPHVDMGDHIVVVNAADIVGDQAAYLQPEMEVTISLHEGAPVAIELPPKAVLEVVETEPTVKGQTAASSYKPALLSNGVRTMVPPFVTTGSKIVVMTADGSYVERAKD